jgi:hypothetical protein
VTWQVGKIPYFGSFGRYTTSSTTTRQRSICGPPLISLIAGRRMFPYLSVCAMRRQGSERNYVVTSRNGHYSRHIAPISKRYHSFWTGRKEVLTSEREHTHREADCTSVLQRSKRGKIWSSNVACTCQSILTKPMPAAVHARRHSTIKDSSHKHPSLSARLASLIHPLTVQSPSRQSP